MKVYLTLPVIAVTTLIVASASLAKPTSVSAAFRAAATGNAGRYISAMPKGALILGSKVLGNKEIFTLVDMNGGTLQDGDSVQVQYASGKHPSYWQENKGKVTRTGAHPDSACTFKVKWKQKNTSLMLRMASGKFVSGPGKGQGLVTVAKASDPTVVFELIKKPTPAKGTVAH